jgi:DNA polymerase III epsilon subunit-like protein
MKARLAATCQEAQLLADGALFAALDVETTGFSPMVGDRIVEIAVVRIAPDGTVTDEYTTVVDPKCDVGPSYIHGLLQEDVEGAPTFHEIVGDVLERLDGVILVAHNLDFDRDFLAAELTREGIFLPALPSSCTLRLSYRMNPDLESHKLESCCQCVGIALPPFHAALEDARVTGSLFLRYVTDGGTAGVKVTDLLEHGQLVFPAEWPIVPPTSRVHLRPSRSSGRLDAPYIARLVATLPPIDATAATAPYLDLLDRALADRRITEAEAAALGATSVAWGLSQGDVAGANLAYLDALVRAALDDGVITSTERIDLVDVARLLGITQGSLDALVATHST